MDFKIKSFLLLLLGLIIKISLAQTKGYSFTITNLKGEIIIDATLSTWRKMKDGQLSSLPCEINKNGETYHIQCPCYSQNSCDSTSILKIEHPGYEVSLVPLCMINPGEKIDIGEHGSKHYTRIIYSPSIHKCIYEVPYVLDSNRVAVKISDYGLKNINKVKDFIQKNGMDFAENIDASNVRKECGVLIKKQDNTAFPNKNCVELEILRKNNKLFSFAGPSINNFQNAFTNYLSIKTKHENKKEIKSFLSRYGKIVKQQSIDDINGDGKLDFTVFLTEVRKDLSEDIISILKEILENSRILECDIFLFCGNKNVKIYPPNYLGKTRHITNKEKKYWEKIKMKRAF